jgi:phosphatidylglycerol:prolipoprotein diacylglycerol transferase
MTLAIWLHNLDPILFQIGPIDLPIFGEITLPIRWYGLSYLAGFYVAYLLVKRVCRVGVSTLKPENAADLVVAVAIGIVLGGRLGYVLLYKPEMFVSFSNELPYWDVLAINHGGMASHGGMIGGMIGCYYYAKRHQHNTLYLIDLFAFTAPLGVFFGRVANFINGELLGRPCSPDVPLTVKFPQELFDMPPEQLAEVYAALPPVGTIVPKASYWDAQLVVDLIHQGSAVVRSAVEPFLTARHPSQLYAGVSEGLIVMAVLLIVWSKPQKPGVIAGTFAIVYAIARIGNEFFRMPDAHLMDKEFALYHITRGQWLSALLFIVGAAMVATSLKRQNEKMGGWRKQVGGQG